MRALAAVTSDRRAPLFPSFSAASLRKLLQSEIARIEGVSPSAVGTHSLRIGGATTMYYATKDFDAVRRFGRWSPQSNMQFLYVWDVIPTPPQVSRGMSSVRFELAEAAAVHANAADRRPWRA